MTTTALDKQKIWDDACAAYVPAADDHKDNVPFYRRWRGAKAVLQALGYVEHGLPDRPTSIDFYNNILHNAICMSEDYKGFVLTMRHFKPDHPAKPNLRIGYRSAPDQATVTDAKRIFASQFKGAYPGKRINSKFANKKWALVKDKAMRLAIDEYKVKLADYMKYEAEIIGFNRRLKKEYDEKCARVQAVLDLVAKLEE